MSLGYDIAQALPGLRAEAESRMTDSCAVTRPGPPVWNEATGEYTSTVVSVYSGKCRVKSPSMAGRDVDAGSRLVVVSQTEVHLPLSAVGVRAGDVVKVTACPTRPDQVGREFVLDAPFDGSQTTALRFRVSIADGR